MIKTDYCLFRQFLILGEQMVPLSSNSEAERLCGEKWEILCNEKFILKRLFTTLLPLISDIFPTDIEYILRFYDKMLFLNVTEE